MLRDQLNETEISGRLKKLGYRVPLRFFESCDSTNTRALEISKSAGIANFLVVSAHQSEGHGRFGRVWRDEPGKSICISALFDVSTIEPKHLGLFGILSGICACNALRKYSGANLELKWPNDIFCEGKKLGGMIASLASASGKILLFGIGVNYRPLEGNRGLECSSLSEVSPNELEINETAAAICAAILDAVHRMKAGQVSDISCEFSKMDFLYGKNIEVNCAGKAISGVAEGIDSEGRLMLRDPSGKILLAGAGESSIVKK